jgi:hypothetical protein
MAFNSTSAYVGSPITFTISRSRSTSPGEETNTRTVRIPTPQPCSIQSAMEAV